MNEIKIINENNFMKEVLEIKEELEKSIKNFEKINELKEKNKLNYIDEYINESNKAKAKIKYNVTYFIPVIQFLDIKSICELSRVNHIFHSFIFSFYFYRSTYQVYKYAIKNKNKNISKKNFLDKNNKKIENYSNINLQQNPQNPNNTENLLLDQTKKIYTNFMSAITGAFNYFNPIPIMPKGTKEGNELEEIEKKIALHEKLIDERIKLIKIGNDITNTKNKIEKYIQEQYDIKSKKKNENGNVNKINLHDDNLLKKIKKEKYENEYKALIKEIKESENELNRIKKDNEKQEKIGIDLENKINKIKYYAKNVLINKENINK